MQGPWDPAWDDVPPLVDANMASQPLRNIPPPPGATAMNSGPPLPHPTPSSAPQYPWGTPLHQYVFRSAHTHPLLTPSDHIRYTFPSQQDPYATWHRYYDPPMYQQKSTPSPYLPRQSFNPQMPSHDPPQQSRRTQSKPTAQPTFHKKPNSVHKHFEWPIPGDLSPLSLPTGMSDAHLYAPRAPEMHTPSSTLSRSVSSSSHIPPGMYHERPQQWRHDFKFKSGFASMFRTRSNTLRSADG